MDSPVAYIIGLLAFVALLIFGIGWAENLGDGAQAQITATCAVHSASPICVERTYGTAVAYCESLADDASAQAGATDQAFSAVNWQEIYSECMKDKP